MGTLIIQLVLQPLASQIRLSSNKYQEKFNIVIMKPWIVCD
jgi:hypothetical protein